MNTVPGLKLKKKTSYYHLKITFKVKWLKASSEKPNQFDN